MQNSEPRILSAAQAIREATDQAMVDDQRVIIIGEGVPDPKGIFGTTLALRETFGSERVWDMPVSENALTGICIGAAISGMRPILTHQRADFALLSLDQIMNNAAKWHYMFGGQVSVPLVIRMVVGHGWGQGTQHSQHLQALFAHIPGLKVVMPASPYDAKGLLLSAIHDNNPVIFLEHRWIHGMKGEVPADMYRIPIGKARRWHAGDDITIVSSGYMTVEALRVSKLLEEVGVGVDLIDLRTIKPWDKTAVLASVEKTGRLLVVDSASPTAGMASEIVSVVAQAAYGLLKAAPSSITFPDVPAPSAPALTKTYYPTYQQIGERVLSMLGRDTYQFEEIWRQEATPVPHDVPDASFSGPF